MRRLISTRGLILSAVAAVLLTLAIPAATLAQGNGHRHRNGDWSNRTDRNRSTSFWRNNRNRHYNKKCGKFVNCHDARAGRIDGRGPRGSRVGNEVWRNRFRNRTNTTNAWRYRDRRNVRRVYVNR